MAHRDLQKTTKQARAMMNPHYEMGSRTWIELAEMAREKPFEGTAEAFLYGYMMGHRACKAEQKMKSPASDGSTHRASHRTDKARAQ